MAEVKAENGMLNSREMLVPDCVFRIKLFKGTQRLKGWSKGRKAEWEKLDK